jgi:Ca-activated chloride channel homolog
MSSRNRFLARLFAGLAGAVSALALLTTPQALMAQEAPAAEESREQLELQEVVTTGMRVRQGGAQDINHFRGEVASERIPHPNELSAEGLMGTHDIVFAPTRPCSQLLCLTGEAATASLMAADHAHYLAAVGFATNIDEKSWGRDPVNLIAVVDKSGSMDGQPLALVRESLKELTRQMRPGDQLSIVLYGDTAHVYMEPTRVSENVATLLRKIDGIESEGSTYMEAGLQVGYDLAFRTAPGFKGRTRLMLFTDEQPNVGETSAESFMGMALEGSKRGVGLTTVGVGVQFDGELATRIASARGGNLYFLRDDDDAKALFSGQLDYMLSELAHDLTLTLTPRAGLKIAGVYGVPGEILGWQDERSVTITVPTVFLDRHGGGIFFTLAPESKDAFLPPQPVPAGSPLADVSVRYLPLGAAAGKVESDSLEVGTLPAGPSEGMRLGHLLIDEYLVLHEATTAHHIRNDPEAAYQLLSAFHRRLDEVQGLPGLDPERKLIGGLHDRFAFLSGHASEARRETNFAKLWGRWKIVSVSGGESDLKRGDRLEFTADNDFMVFGPDDANMPREQEEYRSNDRQLYLNDSELTLYYSVKDSRLSLHHRRTGVRIRAVRES